MLFYIESDNEVVKAKSIFNKKKIKSQNWFIKKQVYKFL